MLNKSISNEATMIDLGETIRLIEHYSDLPIVPAVYETWLARKYTKQHSIPCVSAGILSGYIDNFEHQREALLRCETKLYYDPIEILPTPNQIGRSGEDGIWFMLRNEHLLMGSSRAIKACWGELYHRLSGLDTSMDEYPANRAVSRTRRWFTRG